MSYEEFGTPDMPADPSTPMQESAAAARELFLSYVAAGFTTEQALYLAGCVVAVLAQNEMLRETEIIKQAMLARVMEQADELRRRRGGWADAYSRATAAPADFMGSITPKCFCGRPTIEENGQRVCPVHRSPGPPRMGGGW